MGGQSTHFGFAAADLEQIRQATMVRTIEHHREITSTNTRALALAEEPCLDVPALVLADVQTAGRGRGTHRWWSAPGALTFSLVLPQASPPDEIV